MSGPAAPDAPSLFRESAHHSGCSRNTPELLCSDEQEPYHMPPRTSSPALFGMIILGFIAICALVPIPVRAQAVYGSIFGTITDQTGAVVVGARVSASSVQKRTRFATTTNASGNFRITHLIPDDYDLRVEAPGFQVAESTRLPVYADEAARIDMQLRLGAASEKLTVSAGDIPLMKTDRSDVATNFSKKDI